MWQRIKKWWDDKGLMLFALGFLKVLKMGFRVEEEFATPKRRAKLREFREKMAVMERDKDKMLAAVDLQENTGSDAMYDALEKFTEKYGTPRMVEQTRKSRAHLQTMRTAMDAEDKVLTEIRATHEGNPAEAVAAFRTYVDAHPDTNLGYTSVFVALMQCADYDAAIELCEQRIAHEQEKPTYLAAKYEVQMENQKIAAVLIEKGDVVRAVAHLQKMIAETNEETVQLVSSTYLALGEAYYEGGNIVAAKKAWNETIKRDTLGFAKAEATKRLQEIA